MPLIKKGIRLFFNSLLAMVLERKKDLDKKPKFYLLDTTTKKYISSLYFIARVENTGSITETYAFDFEGKKYLLEYHSDGSYKILEQ